MSITGTDAADQGRGPDRGPDRRDERRHRRARGAARAGPHRARPGRADVAAGRHGRRARVPGHPLDGGRRGARAWPATTTRRSRRTACSRPASAPIQIACGSEGLWRALCGALELGPGRRRLRHQPRAGRAPRRRSSRGSSRTSPTSPPSTGSRLLAEAGVPSGKVRSMDDVYSWDQALLAGPDAHASTTPPSARSTCPGSPLRFDDNPYSGGRSSHEPPPTLGQHNESIREWLDADPAETF